ncbi:MAG TPA: MMPL family transporter [Chloroflexia bacterium]|nr:MMPL family transporter [Chloroflexia bacterium]
MFATLGRFIYTRRWFVLLAGFIFIIASGIYGTTVFGDLKNGGFEDPNAESTRAQRALHEQLGRDEGALLVLFTSADGSTIESADYKAEVEATLAKLSGRPEIGTISTFYNTGAPQFVSQDRKSTYAVVGLAGDDEAQMEHMKELRPLLTSGSLQVRLGGRPAINEEINEQVQKDLERAESMTFPILALLLIVIFGSLIAASLPLAIGGTVILGSFLILKLTTNFTDVSIFAINVITMLGLGLAIDYSLFMVSRFREELTRHDGDVSAALVKTMQTAGRTVVFSALTVAISLMSLMVFPQMFLQSMGLGGAAAVLVALLATLTILPASLALLGHRVNSLSIGSLLRLRRRGRPAPVVAANPQSGFWYRISTLVMRRPGIVLALTAIPLLVAGLPFLRINLSIPDARSLPAGRDSRVVSEILESQFPRNETVPIQLVVRTDGAMLSPAGISALYDYTRRLEELPGVRRIDSLVTLDPTLDKSAYQQFYSEANISQDPQARAVADGFARGGYSLISVLYDSDPLSPQSEELVRSIRALPAPGGMTVQVGGLSASLVDFLSGLAASVPVALSIVVAVIFILLFLMLGSIVVPLKAVLLNILSLSASFGALVWIFQDGNFADWLGFTPLGSIDGTQPVLIFAIAFGLSMDYEVFLLSRIKEHYDRTKDVTASVAIGVQKTGAIITSAALLLFVVIGSFATGEILLIKQIGVGLGLAILVDATIVRTLLVPASMRLMGKYNWWAPAPLTKLYNRIGMSEVEHEDKTGETPAQAPAPLKRDEAVA